MVRLDTGEQLLRDMIGAVLELPAPIRELEILNPEIPEVAPGDKSIVKHARFSDLFLRQSGLGPQVEHASRQAFQER